MKLTIELDEKVLSEALERAAEQALVEAMRQAMLRMLLPETSAVARKIVTEAQQRLEATWGRAIDAEMHKLCGQYIRELLESHRGDLQQRVDRWVAEHADGVMERIARRELRDTVTSTEKGATP